MRDAFGTDMVRVVRNPGTPEEESFEVEAQIQGKTGSFDVNTPVFTGDYVEVGDPRRGEDGVELRYVASARVLTGGPESMHRVKVEWGDAPTRDTRVAPVRPLSFENLHPEVQAASGDLFADGHFESAVNEAFKSLEVRVRTATGIRKAGAALMGDAFRADGSVLDVAGHQGRSGDDEREGFLHIFRGAMIGVRNPGAHELFRQGDPEQALEYLSLASLLHRRVDAAEAKRP
jgi:uncharacterized protein (TIGR02391 family)